VKRDARFEDMLSDPRAEDASDDAVLAAGRRGDPAPMACLGERERMVIQARYGLGASAPRTLRELADGATGERHVVPAPNQ